MFSEVSEAEVRHDLEQLKGDKTKLSQQYCEQQNKVVQKYGGNITDVPIDPENEYYKIQAKLRLLGKL